MFNKIIDKDTSLVYIFWDRLYSPYFLATAQISSLIVGLWLLFFVIFMPVSTTAQNFPVHRYTMREGLPSMAIRSIYKDSRGLLWIGTDAGLCNFDGRTFHIFKSSDGITANGIWAITEDEKGILWFGSYGEGLFKYDGKKFRKFTTKDGLIDNHIKTLLYSVNFHCLVVGTINGLSTIKGNNIINSPADVFVKPFTNHVTGLADAGKYIYITTFGLNNPLRFYPDQNLFISLATGDELKRPCGFSVLIGSHGDTIFSNGNGVKIIKRDGGIVLNDSMGEVYGISEDKRGDLWFASWSYPNRDDLKEGVFKYDGSSFINFKDAFGIKDKEIWTVYCDKEQDILWVGTLNDGLLKVPYSSITNYPASCFGKKNQSINNVFVDSKNLLWILGDHELARLSQDGNISLIDKKSMLTSFRAFWKVRNQKKYGYLDNVSTKILNIKADTLSSFEQEIDLNFQNIVESDEHSVFFTNRIGLFKYSEKSSNCQYLGQGGIFGEFAIQGRDTLLTTQWGPTKLIPDYFRTNCCNPETLFFYLHKDGEKFGRGEPRDVNRLVKLGNYCWFATSSSGLWVSEGYKLINFNEADSTISDKLNDICFDQKGNVIFGSNTGEICIATYANKKLNINYRISDEHGLQGTSISWLVADKKGNLWVGTNLGLNCIDLNELYKNNKIKTRFIDEQEGYSGQTSKRAVLDSDGKLWIAGGDKLICLNTTNFLASAIQTGKIILKAVEVNHSPISDIPQIGELAPWSAIPEGKIKLNYLQNNFVFYFDILNYNNPEKSEFRYRLLGYEKVWNVGSLSRKAVYTNLPAGKYHFSVESVNNSTDLKAEPLNFVFTIAPPWWQIWYIDLSVVLILLVLIVTILRNYIEIRRRKLLEKSEFERKIVELQMQALQALMNPHFIFNCISGIQYFILANKTQEVLNYLADFSKVIRESMANATLRMVPLDSVISFLHSYLRLEQMRFPEKFEYKIICVDELDEDFICMPPMLIQPFVENAVTHGLAYLKDKGQLSIVFDLVDKDILKCTITDNGVGRSHKEHKKVIKPENDRLHSTAIIANRIRLFNSPLELNKYRIEFTDLYNEGIPKGLQVELYLPIE